MSNKTLAERLGCLFDLPDWAELLGRVDVLWAEREQLQRILTHKDDLLNEAYEKITTLRAENEELLEGREAWKKSWLTRLVAERDKTLTVKEADWLLKRRPDAGVVSGRPRIINNLLAENAALRRTIDMHVADIASLRAKNLALQAKNAALEGENEELKERLRIWREAVERTLGET